MKGLRLTQEQADKAQKRATEAWQRTGAWVSAVPFPVAPQKPVKAAKATVWHTFPGLPTASCEYRFSGPRRWRFDYAWPELKIALEIEGGVWTGGRHTRGAGFLGDMEKYNRAAFLGWRVFRATPDQLKTGEILEQLKPVLRLP